MSRIRRVVLTVAVLVVPVAALPPAPLAAQGSYEDLQTFAAVLNYVRLNYVDSVSYQGLVRGAIGGMLQTLDPHSRLVTRIDFAREDSLNHGELPGSGLSFELVEGRPTVLGVLSGSPAERAGVLAGDRILSVDDTSALGVEPHALQLRLSGPKGTKVHLHLERGSLLAPDTLAVTLKLAPVLPPAVSEALMLDSMTGLIRLEAFERPDAVSEVGKAIDGLRHHGMRRLVLDLRWNPGGLVSGASGLSELFLPAGSLVFRTEGRRAEFDRRYATDHDGKFRDLPLAVVINEWTASAAEAFAGAMQDHDRAVLVGHRTFGKALMQQAFPLPNGDVIWLTVGHILSPSGRVIQRRYEGLNPLQYEMRAGRGGALSDTVTLYHTDRGRPVRGGGGIRPDVEVAADPVPPRWWTLAVDSGLTTLIADSVATSLGRSDRDLADWTAGGVPLWTTRVEAPLLSRLRPILGTEPPADSAVRARVARALAVRVVEVRWGEAARDAFQAGLDPDVQAARGALDRAAVLLAPPAP